MIGILVSVREAGKRRNVYFSPCVKVIVTLSNVTTRPCPEVYDSGGVEFLHEMGVIEGF